MISFIAVRCPGCGADLSVEEGMSTDLCTYCGAKVLISSENEHIYKHIDEVEIKTAEPCQAVQLPPCCHAGSLSSEGSDWRSCHMVQMKKTEMADERHQISVKNNMLRIVISLGLLVFGLLVMISGSEYAVMAGVFAMLAAACIWLFSGTISNGRNNDPHGRV